MANNNLLFLLIVGMRLVMMIGLRREEGKTVQDVENRQREGVEERRGFFVDQHEFFLVGLLLILLILLLLMLLLLLMMLLVLLLPLF